MNYKKFNSSALISSTLSLILLSASATSYAESDKKEQCAGVVRAGLNDCASSEHACAGMNADDGYESDWVWVPTGTCKKIAGAHIIGVGKPNK